MGPSFTVQADNASGLIAVCEGAWDTIPSAHLNKAVPDACLCTGVYLNLSPFWWPLFNTYMNPVGRAFTFDQDANGWVRAEGCSTICLMRHGEMVDGKWTVNEDIMIAGTLSGWAITQNGTRASLSAPNA